jgi:hypothetical protein
MKNFYSKTHKGFFNSDLHAAESMPEDAVDISEEAYKALFDGQSAGKIIKWDAEAPYLADRVLSNEELEISARYQRDELLKNSDWTQNSDIPQATKDKWVSYRQALRDVPNQSGFPANIVWPTLPQ